MDSALQAVCAALFQYAADLSVGGHDDGDGGYQHAEEQGGGNELDFRHDFWDLFFLLLRFSVVLDARGSSSSCVDRRSWSGVIVAFSAFRFSGFPISPRFFDGAVVY